MAIVYRVLEAAKAAEDDYVIGLCRQCILANRLGWRRYNGPAAFEIISEFDF